MTFTVPNIKRTIVLLLTSKIYTKKATAFNKVSYVRIDLVLCTSSLAPKL